MDRKEIEALEYLAKLDPRLLSIEKRTEKKLIRFFNKIEKDFNKTLKDMGRVETLKIHAYIEEFIEENKEEFKGIIVKGAEAGAKYGALQLVQADLKRHAPFARFSLGDIHPEVYEKIKTRRALYAEKKMIAVDLKMTEMLQKGYEQGLGIDELADSMSKVLTTARNQSRTIARTEINGAKNEVAWENLNSLGIEKKEWSNSDDARVRPSHVAIGGEIKNMDEPFSNGLMYPLDPNGPPEEVINCRCSILSYIE